MSIDHTDPRPPFRQIADDLRKQIYAGDLAPGAQLPSERELVAQYGTAHQTVRQAVNLLKTEGLAIGKTGRGVFVRENPPLQLRLQATKRFVSQARAQGRTAEARLLGVEQVTPPSEIAAALNLAGPDHAIVRRYLLLVDDEPVQIGESYFPEALVGQTSVAEASDFTPGQMDRDLKQRLGIEPSRFVDELAVRMPTTEQTRELRLLPGTPVAQLTRTYYDSGDRPFEVARFVLAGDRQVLIYEGEPTPET